MSNSMGNGSGTNMGNGVDEVIDLATFRALQDSAGADFVSELVDAYLEEAPKMLGTLRASLAARDEDAFRRAAHSLKSNSMTFGATTLAAMARNLELTAHEVVGQGISGVLDAPTDEQQRVAAALQGLRDA
jgi:HPt (histidine-containing phosphotransfer) domain-containing protein